jgi:Putative MetA-pathway of phenol degradation
MLYHGISIHPAPSLLSGMKHLLCVSILLPIFSSGFAQFNETIRADRPSETVSPFTVGQGIFQVQSGFERDGSQNNGQDLKSHSILNNTVVRYGLTELFEINALVEYRNLETTLHDVKTSFTGLSALDVGMRYHILTGEGLVPNIGFQFRVRLPVLSGPYEIKDIAPRINVMTSQRLSKKLTLATNWGAAWNGNDSSPTGAYTVNLSFPVCRGLNAFVETFGGLKQGDLTTDFDGGFAWIVQKNLQLDLYGGYGNNKGTKTNFVTMGVSWRTNKRKAGDNGR